jgi:hypothetical protein
MLPLHQSWSDTMSRLIRRAAIVLTVLGGLSACTTTTAPNPKPNGCSEYSNPNGC